MSSNTIIKNTADIREKILKIWKLVDEKKISASEARLHMGLARAILETLKVEIAAAHLSRLDIPSVPVRGKSLDAPVSVSRQ